MQTLAVLRSPVHLFSPLTIWLVVVLMLVLWMLDVSLSFPHAILPSNREPQFHEVWGQIGRRVDLLLSLSFVRVSLAS